MNPTHGRTLFNYQNGSDDHYQQKKEVSSVNQKQEINA